MTIVLRISRTPRIENSQDSSEPEGPEGSGVPRTLRILITPRNAEGSCVPENSSDSENSRNTDESKILTTPTDAEEPCSAENLDDSENSWNTDESRI